MYALTLIFAVHDRSRAPSVEVLAEAIGRTPLPAGRVEHVYAVHDRDELHAVVFVAAVDRSAALSAGPLFGRCAAAAVTAIAFTHWRLVGPDDTGRPP